MAAAPTGTRTLAVKEPQILHHYPADTAGFYWHHKILLYKISPGVFIGVTPDGDLERINLYKVDYLPLEHRSNFPVPQGPYVHTFNDLFRADLERYTRRA